MGTSINWAICNKCGNDEIAVVFEWKNKNEAIEEIKKVKCDKCGSENIYFSDVMG